MQIYNMNECENFYIVKIIQVELIDEDGKKVILTQLDNHFTLDALLDKSCNITFQNNLFNKEIIESYYTKRIFKKIIIKYTGVDVENAKDKHVLFEIPCDVIISQFHVSDSNVISFSLDGSFT